MRKLLSPVLALCMVFALAATASADGLTGEFTMVHFNNANDTMGTALGFHVVTEAFKAANPDVTISADFIAHDDYEAYITTLMAGALCPMCS